MSGCQAAASSGSMPTAPSVPASSSSVAVSARVSSGASESSPPASASASAARDVGVESEARTILDELVRVDTSHGNETLALQPLVARFKQAGVEAQILESAPGRGNLIARLRGNGAKKPMLLVAHIDVVPVEGQPWTSKPFEPTTEGAFLQGRGVGDDKGMAAAFTAIVLELARQKRLLSRDIILALTAGEETGGDAGVGFLVKEHRDRIDAEFALNEGAAIFTSNDFDHVTAVSCGASEKVSMNFHLTVAGKGGHSAMPYLEGDPMAELGRALVKVSEFKFPAHVASSAKGSLELAATMSKPPLSSALAHAAASAPKISPDDAKIISSNRAYSTLIRTTCVTTMLKGAPQANVLPSSVEATVNCRILPDETVEATKAALVKAIGSPLVTVSGEDTFKPGPESPLEGPVPSAVREVTHAMWPDAKVVGSMSSGATDSRFLRAIGMPAYGVGGTPSSFEEFTSTHGAHGADERRPLKWIGPGVKFLEALVTKLAN